MKNRIMTRPRRFYRYLIYRIYHINNNDPDIKVVTLLCIIHSAHLFTCMYLILGIFSINLFTFNKLELFIAYILFLALHYYIFYKPQKWEEYFKEFENETKEERLKGSFLVWGYMTVSLMMPFIIVIYLAYR